MTNQANTNNNNEVSKKAPSEASSTEVASTEASSKEVTKLVRSMRQALKSQHGIDVPYSALRASFLHANGENMHASSGKAKPAKQSKAKPVTAEPEVKVSSVFPETVDLHYVTDENGDERLSFCRDEGEAFFMLPEGWQFTEEDAELVLQDCTIPSIRKYGLPDWLSDARRFYRNYFGLALSKDYQTKVFDSHDDGGGKCKLTIRMTSEAKVRMMQSMLDESEYLSAEVAEWVGTHHLKNFDKESDAQRADWIIRYLKIQGAD